MPLTGQVTAALNASRSPGSQASGRDGGGGPAESRGWPAAHHGYKAAEVAQLVGTFDDVVAEMRIASGGNQFDLSLVATAMPPAALPALMPALDVRGSLETAYRAALLAGDPDEKVALLRTLTEQLAFAPSTATWAPALRTSASAALTAELQVEQAYINLARKALKQAGERAQKADVRGLQQVIAQVLSADDRLGRRRSGQMNGLLTTLDIRLDEARRLRLARDARAARIDQVWQYRLATRTPRRRIIGLRAWLEDIRDLSGPDRGALPKINSLSTLALQEFASIHVPADLQAVHAMLLSAVQMGSQAASLRQTAITSNTLKLAWDASAAAAGALLLWQRAHDELAVMAGDATNPAAQNRHRRNPPREARPGDHPPYNPAYAGAGSQNHARGRRHARGRSVAGVVCRAGAVSGRSPGAAADARSPRPDVAREDVRRSSDTCRVLRPARAFRAAHLPAAIQKG